MWIILATLIVWVIFGNQAKQTSTTTNPDAPVIFEAVEPTAAPKPRKTVLKPEWVDVSSIRIGGDVIRVKMFFDDMVDIMNRNGLKPTFQIPHDPLFGGPTEWWLHYTLKFPDRNLKIYIEVDPDDFYQRYRVKYIVYIEH